MTIEWVPSTSVTTSGSIYYYLDLDPASQVPTVADIPQQYRAKVNALYQASSVTFTESEINQAFRRYRVRNDDSSSDQLTEFDFGKFIFAATSTASDSYG